MRVFKKHNIERRVATDAAAEKLKNKGYKEVAVAASKGTEADSETTDLSKMKVDELKTLAETNGIEGVESLTKKELIAVLKDVV